MILKTVFCKSPLVFSTDMCKDCSVKGVEERQRGSGDKLIVGRENTKRPKDWRTFLTNDENKEQLIQVLLSTWSNSSFSKLFGGHEVTLICKGHAYHLSSEGSST